MVDFSVPGPILSVSREFKKVVYILRYRYQLLSCPCLINIETLNIQYKVLKELRWDEYGRGERRVKKECGDVAGSFKAKYPEKVWKGQGIRLTYYVFLED